MTHLDDAALDEAQVREAVGDTILLTTHNGLDCGPDPTPIHNVALMIVEDVFRPLLAAVRDAQRRAQAAEAALQRVRELHSPFRIYDECGHEHRYTDDGEPPDGTIEIAEIGITCDDGLQYLVCRECCADLDGYCQNEDCATYHTHGPDVPYCGTIAALDAGQEAP